MRLTTPRTSLIISSAWLAPALLAVMKEYVRALVGGGAVPDTRVLVFEGVDWLIYGLLTPFVLLLARRYPLTRDTLTHRLPIHLVASVGLCVAWALAGWLLSLALFGTGPYGGSLLDWFFTSLPFGVAVYFAVLGVEHALLLLRRGARARDPGGAASGAARRGAAGRAPDAAPAALPAQQPERRSR